ncbi:mannonate dehydratase [Neolewinella sp.]|uniref:mannonate dehydratase n=1 Tax=Neolewinella sp. TaxID=2993543 RepID=UPI003B5264B0
MIFTALLPATKDDRKWSLAAQVGVRQVITKAASDLSGLPPPYNYRALETVVGRFREAGFTVYGLEGDQFDMQPIKLGTAARDEAIDRYRQLLHNMGRLGIRMHCYNFMASLGWYRTRVDVPARGGAQVSEFRLADVGDDLAPELRISENRLWQNLFYFLDAVLPVAEEEGVQLALHPDDPPLSPLRGVGRILTSAAACDRVLAHRESPSNGLTFCQATFRAMGEDLIKISTPWLKAGKVHFLHLRDIEGTPEDFRETFHDNGPTDMVGMLRHYHAHGFDGPLRPDHAPAMYGEVQGAFASSTSVGYEMTGKIFALGYLRGICEASGIAVN